MEISKIPFGENFPAEVHAVIEIPQHSGPVKYELHKESGAVFVDRFLTTPMYYPANYGFVPRTLGGDGDPLDILVVCPFPLNVGSVICAKVIGVLMMEDEKGMDEKIISVPAESVSKEYASINEIKDLPDSILSQIQHFFEHYKDLEKGKWVKLSGFKTAKEAREILIQSKLE